MPTSCLARNTHFMFVCFCLRSSSCSSSAYCSLALLQIAGVRNKVIDRVVEAPLGIVTMNMAKLTSGWHIATVQFRWLATVVQCSYIKVNRLAIWAEVWVWSLVNWSPYILLTTINTFIGGNTTHFIHISNWVNLMKYDIGCRVRSHKMLLLVTLLQTNSRMVTHKWHTHNQPVIRGLMQQP